MTEIQIMAKSHKTKVNAYINKVVLHASKTLAKNQFSRVKPFLQQYFAEMAPEELLSIKPELACDAALEHWNFIQQRSHKKPIIRVFQSEQGLIANDRTVTVIEVLSDDMPFLVDSITMELNRQNCGIHMFLHPVFGIERDSKGKLKKLHPREISSDDNKKIPNESLIHVEVDRILEPEKIKALQSGLERVLLDVRRAVGDWTKIRKRLHAVVERFETGDIAIPDTYKVEIKAFLEWLDQKNFIFLGFQNYKITTKGKNKVFQPVAGSALGILKNKLFSAKSEYTINTVSDKKRNIKDNILLISKSIRQCTVHRPGYMDYIAIRDFNAEGKVIGEVRFLGLYTSSAYRRHPQEVPIIRAKINKVFSSSKLDPSSHTGKAFLHILETFPRDELVQISENDLYHTAQGILHLGERKRLKLFVREDSLKRFMSCIVYVPRDNYHSSLRSKIDKILLKEFLGIDLTFKLKLGDESFARIEYFIKTDPKAFAQYKVDAIEKLLIQESHSWDEQFRNIVIENVPEQDCLELLKNYQNAFSRAYQESFSVESAIHDTYLLQKLKNDGLLKVNFYINNFSGSNSLCLKLYSESSPIAPSDSLPILENMGFKVLQESPYKIKTNDQKRAWIHDYILETPMQNVGLDKVKNNFEEVFVNAWYGEIESDGFNALVLNAGLDCREITILRAYCKYLLQAGLTFSQNYMEQCFNKYPAITQLLVQFFKTRFEPALDRAKADKKTKALSKKIFSLLDEVSSLDEDRILRNYMSVIEATVRTSFYQLDNAIPKPYIAFKFDTAKVLELPEPRPMFEIFVYSPTVEGVHLRSGKVARGGLRWSDRREDFRTEVLGLVKAQRVKNSVIVPAGAKGGFVVKRPPTNGTRDDFLQEGVRCYQQFISALLTVSDNTKNGRIQAPKNVVRYDGDDPYLVVAADKGTATFSDFANEIAMQHNFWLGDAFASGGSNGYDHKRMGITARGAWESVKLHFRDIGKNIQKQDFTVIGIGDMGGDVFGNGMLLSKHIRLQGAFNHLHIFLDPSPDARTSYKERQRLFKLPRSSWADYNTKLISAGGGVYSRSAKFIPLSSQVREMLGTDNKQVTPNELIQLLLKAPVDLLWNGGIGTYVKASYEQHNDVGDRVNDAVRVNAVDLSAKVVGEGGNLGLTQQARIEYALHGGRIDTDSIHNAGGVDCSDHEVNIKILLNQLVTSNALREKQRDVLLGDMTHEVANLVLESNYWQAIAITLIDSEAFILLDEHTRYMRALESNGQLVRSIEDLPDEERLLERKAAGQGLTRPEISVLISYSKIIAKTELVDSDLWNDPYFAAELLRYFPVPLRKKYANQIHKHPLREEILATFIVNRMVNRMGCTFVFRLQEETGATTAEITRAYTIAWEVFNLREIWTEIAALDHKVPAEVQTEMMLEATRLIYRASKWLIQYRKRALGIGKAIEDYSKGAEKLAQWMPQMIQVSKDPLVRAGLDRFLEQGVAKPLALKAVCMDAFYCVFDIVDISNKMKLPLDTVIDTYFRLSDYLDIFWLRVKMREFCPDNHWQDLARTSLIDDLYAVLHNMTIEVLRVGGKQEKPQQRIAKWHAQNQQAVDRCMHIPQDLKVAEHLDLAMFSVSLRELHNLYQSSTSNRL